MTSKYSDDDPIPVLEVNEVGDELPGSLVPISRPDPNLSPEECAHPDCKKTPIVGVNKRFICADHIKWVLNPIREIVRLVWNSARG